MTDAGPTFLGIGAMRSGTTWTWRCLSGHTQISFPGGKQVHFWDQNHDRGIEWYRQTLSDADHRIRGDLTPAYAILDDARVAEVARAFPDLRVFYTVRNPVDRAWSSAQLYLRRNDIDPGTVTDEWYEQRLASSGIRKRNQYRSTVSRWEEAFGQDRFLVLRFRQLCEEPNLFLARIAAHVGADPREFTHPKRAMAAEIGAVRNATSGSMPDHLRAFASELYAEDLAWFDSFERNAQ